MLYHLALQWYYHLGHPSSGKLKHLLLDVGISIISEKSVNLENNLGHHILVVIKWEVMIFFI